MVFTTRGLILIDLNRGRVLEGLKEKHSVPSRLRWPVAGLSSCYSLCLLVTCVFFTLYEMDEKKRDSAKGLTKYIKPHTNVTV
jgi:hypothetical protein